MANKIRVARAGAKLIAAGHRLTAAESGPWRRRPYHVACAAGATLRSLSRVAILSFSEVAIRRAKTLQAAKLNVRKMDLCIAAIALEHQAIVVTRQR